MIPFTTTSEQRDSNASVRLACCLRMLQTPIGCPLSLNDSDPSQKVPERAHVSERHTTCYSRSLQKLSCALLCHLQALQGSIIPIAVSVHQIMSRHVGEIFKAKYLTHHLPLHLGRTNSHAVEPKHIGHRLCESDSDLTRRS